VNNQSSLFTIPLKDASQNRLIRDIELVQTSGWQKKLLKTMEHAYKKAPHFKELFPVISAIINAEISHIYQLASLSIISIAAYLGIPTVFVKSSVIYHNANLKSQERILDICIREKADHYINPSGGMEIYSRNLFEESGVRLNFLKARPVSYKQFNGEFVPFLSIIDVLMFNSKEASNQLLGEYELL